jgi:hypothetical protein
MSKLSSGAAEIGHVPGESESLQVETRTVLFRRDDWPTVWLFQNSNLFRGLEDPFSDSLRNDWNALKCLF